MDKGELTIEHCPTKLMIADYMTKLLQGKQFEIFRRLIMGWKPVDDMFTSIWLSAKERIGNIMAKQHVTEEKRRLSKRLYWVSKVRVVDLRKYFSPTTSDGWVPTIFHPNHFQKIQSGLLITQIEFR